MKPADSTRHAFGVLTAIASSLDLPMPVVADEPMFEQSFDMLHELDHDDLARVAHTLGVVAASYGYGFAFALNRPLLQVLQETAMGFESIQSNKRRDV